MKTFLKNIVKDFVGSLNTKPGGFSLRKLTALTVMVCVVYLHWHYVDFSNVVSVLVYDMLFVLLLYGIITFDQLYKLKMGSGITKPAEPIEPEKPKTNENADPTDAK